MLFRSYNSLDKWLNPFLEGLLPEDINRELFMKTALDNITFPYEAVELAKNVFSDPFNLSEEAILKVKSIGNDFFKLARQSFENCWPNWQECVKDLSDNSGKKGKELFQPLRISLTGQQSGPELDQLSILLGKKRVLERLDKASEV